MTRNHKQPLVPEAAEALKKFKGTVMAEEGYPVDLDNPEKVKYEVAQELGIPLTEGYNGNLKTKNAGKVGGTIGGKMVHEMIRLAQKKLLDKH